MAVYMLGNRDVVHFGPRKFPKRYKYWAERGLIHLEDAEDNSYVTLSVREFLLRLKGINDMIAKVSRGEKTLDPQELQRHQNFIEQALALVEKAKEQGMPTDPSARRDRARRRPTSVVVPGRQHSF